MARIRPLGWRTLLVATVLQVAPMVSAQGIATSSAPDRVSVTVYRDPDRAADRAMDLTWLNGFALVTEVRQVSISAGESDIRFEGVAGGIIPESAIVTGLPEGVIEKNQDAYLLSPASLLDRSLGKRVHIRRTSTATGRVTEEEAVIRTGAAGAVVLQTAAGFEALRCTGLLETIVYDSVPEGLSARPTLSVRVRSTRPVSATVTLSYLATGFDWQANYVATLAPSEDRLDLFAWVTLANGDETSFVNADTQTVAGRLNRVSQAPSRRRRNEQLRLQCWPAGTTSDIGRETGPYPPPPPPPPAPMAMASEEIMVSARRRDEKASGGIMVAQEELGDLKLYRVPLPVTVAANSQKQVALLDREGVKAEIFYRAMVSPDDGDGDVVPMRILKMRNRIRDGLGLPLPMGQVALFGAGYARPVLIGEGRIDDKAVDEDVEVELPAPAGVTARAVRTLLTDGSADHVLTISSDRDRPIRFDAEFTDVTADRLKPLSVGKLGKRNGRPLWSVTVPANGTAILRYRLRRG